MATQTTNYGLTLPNYDEMADIDVINENMDLIDAQMKKNADGVGQAKSIVSDAYSGSLTYNVGDYCIYDNKMYRCITAVTTAEAFDSAKWQETSVKSELSTLNSNSANMELLYENNDGIGQGSAIYFNQKTYKVFAIQIGGESLIFVRLYTKTLQNISAGIPVLIHNGTDWISVNRIIRFDSYSEHWFIQQLADFDSVGNAYSDGRKVCAIYGVK